ncbi:MAG: hypothetical protein R3F61_05490 [Myxococcota bacterium]
MSALLCALVGCGVSASTPLSDLDDDDWAALCEEATADSVPRTQECDTFVADVPAYTAADCIADVAFLNAGCDAVVGDWQTCVQATMTADLCSRLDISACDLVAECSSI